MWSVPDGSPSLQSDIAFNTVDFTKLVEDYDERESKQSNSAKRLSVVDLFVIDIVKNLHRPRELILANKLVIEVHYGVVKAARENAANDSENQELLTRIARMRPDTISWSNVLDYFLPEDFHDVARRCSMYGGCVHYGYSMNWPTQVFGASIIDYEQEHRSQIIDDIVCSALGISSESKVLPIPSVVTMCKTAGLDKLLHLTFHEHPLNSTAYTLAHMFNEEWIDNFMKKGQMTINAFQRLGASVTPSNCELQMGAMDLAIPSPLYRSSLTLHMSWCYDLAVHLVADSLDLNSAVELEIFARLMQHLAV